MEQAGLPEHPFGSARLVQAPQAGLEDFCAASPLRVVSAPVKPLSQQIDIGATRFHGPPRVFRCAVVRSN